MKALFINGSPRKNKNTVQMLESAMRGAQEAGAETELINLYDLDYKGCVTRSLTSSLPSSSATYIS